MMQQKSDDDFGIPQFGFKPISSSKRKKWALIVFFMLLLMSGGIISCWRYMFYKSSTSHPDHYEILFDDDKEMEHSFVLPNNDNDDYEESEENFYRESKSSDLDAVKKKLKIISKRQAQLIKKGTYQQVSSPQGIFHIVVGMFCDITKAMDCVHRLIKKNKGVMLLMPPQGEHYYRVTIEHTATHEEAEKKLKLLKPLYGENIFILHY